MADATKKVTLKRGAVRAFHTMLSQYLDGETSLPVKFALKARNINKRYGETVADINAVIEAGRKTFFDDLDALRAKHGAEKNEKGEYVVENDELVFPTDEASAAFKAEFVVLSSETQKRDAEVSESLGEDVEIESVVIPETILPESLPGNILTTIVDFIE